MKLFIVHCGFYDSKIQSGLFEGHTNIYVAAHDAAEARAKVKERSDFRKLKMHVDGLQELVAIDGYEIKLVEKKNLEGKTIVRNQKIGSRIAVQFELD